MWPILNILYVKEKQWLKIKFKPNYSLMTKKKKKVKRKKAQKGERNVLQDTHSLL